MFGKNPFILYIRIKFIIIVAVDFSLKNFRGHTPLEMGIFVDDV